MKLPINPTTMPIPNKISDSCNTNGCGGVILNISKDRKQNRNDRAQRSDDHSFHHKRRPDKPIRRTYVPHDRNFVASRVNRQLDRVRDQENRQRA